jgi:hypothetical protein
MGKRPTDPDKMNDNQFRDWKVEQAEAKCKAALTRVAELETQLQITPISKTIPRRFIVSKAGEYVRGCYFPATDLCVRERGSFGTGVPTNYDTITWIDPPPEHITEVKNEDVVDTRL